MARRFGVAIVKDVSLVADTVQTLIQLIAATNHAVAITEISFSAKGTNNTYEPIEVELIRQTDAGTAVALSLVKRDDSIADTLDTTAQKTFTAEPTEGDLLDSFTVHPQSALFLQEHDLVVPVIGASDRVGLRAKAQNAVDVNVKICFEE